MSASSQSLRFILSLRMTSCFITARPGFSVVLISVENQCTEKTRYEDNIKISTKTTRHNYSCCHVKIIRKTNPPNLKNDRICFMSLFNIINEKTSKEPRTSDSLNKVLPIKMTKDKFQRKLYFVHEKDSRLSPGIIRKSVFSPDECQLKNICLI